MGKPIYGLGEFSQLPEVEGERLPSISIVIPTYNSQQYLPECLKSILAQDYPRSKIEIIIADGGSSDNTLEIARNAGVDIIANNPLKTGEAGKAVGVKKAQNDIIALIDSDNILPEKSWLRKMVWPFIEDREIVATEPLYYTYRETDPVLTRYSALLGMNDPLCLFLGNYDRYCVLTGKWTNLHVPQVDQGNYIKVSLGKEVPTIGANGFMIKRNLVSDVGDYLFDIELLGNIISIGQNKVAKVKIGIVHLYGKDSEDFKRKQRRRINDYLLFKSRGLRKYPWLVKRNKLQIMKFIVYTVTTIPLLLQALSGYAKFRDDSWKFHVIACWLTLMIYAKGAMRSGTDQTAPKSN
ncbi:glycosyltransferase family 2 protein [Nitrososphaera sp.]|uniref:glycosyltransferase family 2 protein n=1 Tax=Nitrososphaera sp. TaxID=1971748 RepID=UPI001847AB8D|nr:glycosyltransferase family 2 protein [Nitrososphaera sp.]NWG36458.1 glycosyltransferase family 2 protein [Nitrososphaera sp.]